MFLQKALFRNILILLFFIFPFLRGNCTNILPVAEMDTVSIELLQLDSADFSVLCNEVIVENADKRPNPILQMFKVKQKKNKKITAAILAFPFPFGIVGLHRIYLGTAPYVPVVYIGTLGGVFGILPFIDFCVLVLDKDISRYLENKKVMMWVNENKKPAK